MTNTPWNEPFLRVIGRLGLSLLALFTLFILSAVPFKIPHFGEIRPLFMLMAVYYWTVVRPAPLPSLFIFITGLFLDLLAAYPLGMNALLLVIAQWVTGVQRKFLMGQSFLVVWAGFFLLAGAAGFVQWAFFSLFSTSLVSATPMLASVVLSAFLFPLMALALYIIHKALTDQGAGA
jgi:rod shape-determining protein MreD